MNMRAMYRIFRKPVRLEKVIDGLWVTATPPGQADSDDDYFLSVSLFKKPMQKAQPGSREHKRAIH